MKSLEVDVAVVLSVRVQDYVSKNLKYVLWSVSDKNKVFFYKLQVFSSVSGYCLYDADADDTCIPMIA